MLRLLKLCLFAAIAASPAFALQAIGSSEEGARIAQAGTCCCGPVCDCEACGCCSGPVCTCEGCACCDGDSCSCCSAGAACSQGKPCCEGKCPLSEGTPETTL